uniref:C-type lectin domain-containing protein n=1 Tax=Callorhinchus milii TaxID=7868 RepID=A0A4W3JWP1_CALMI
MFFNQKCYYFKVCLKFVSILVTHMFSEMRASQADMKNKVLQLKNNGPSCVLCPDEWTFFNQKCYYFSSNNLNWKAAQSKCVSMKSNLVVIKTKKEQVRLSVYNISLAKQI